MKLTLAILESIHADKFKGFQQSSVTLRLPETFFTLPRPSHLSLLDLMVSE